MNNLSAKRQAALDYLKARGKWLLTPGCKFTPSPALEKFSILKRYGQEKQK